MENNIRQGPIWMVRQKNILKKILVFRQNIIFSYLFKDILQKILMMNSFQLVTNAAVFQKFFRSLKKAPHGCQVNPFGQIKDIKTGEVKGNISLYLYFLYQSGINNKSIFNMSIAMLSFYALNKHIKLDKKEHLLFFTILVI